MDIPKNCLKEWILQSENFKGIKCQTKTFHLKGGGKTPQIIEIKNELFKWLEELRRLEICVTSHELIYKAIELDKTLEKKTFNALYCWCYDFLKRYSYSIRRATHIRQKLKDNNKEQFKQFFSILYNIRNNLEKKNIYPIIYNMDETPIMFEMVSKTTICEIGTRNVNVRTFGSDRIRIILILSIGSDGTKLPTLIVFKGKKNTAKEKQLKDYCLKNNYKITELCQENAWADTEI